MFRLQMCVVVFAWSISISGVLYLLGSPGLSLVRAWALARCRACAGARQRRRTQMLPACDRPLRPGIRVNACHLATTSGAAGRSWYSGSVLSVNDDGSIDVA